MNATKSIKSVVLASAMAIGVLLAAGSTEARAGGGHHGGGRGGHSGHSGYHHSGHSGHGGHGGYHHGGHHHHPGYHHHHHHGHWWWNGTQYIWDPNYVDPGYPNDVDVDPGYLGQGPVQQDCMLGITEQAVDGGVQVVAVDPGSPAEQAGVQVGDVLTQANGYLTQAPGNLCWIVQNAAPNRVVDIQIIRDCYGTSVQVQF